MGVDNTFCSFASGFSGKDVPDDKHDFGDRGALPTHQFLLNVHWIKCS